ncbi:reverse transcriptase domain-containing protein [Tanacetum coccineum]
MRVQSVSVNVDSKLVASQINGSYVVCQERMIIYLTKAKEYIKCSKSFKIRNIPQNQNQKAGVLSKLASIAFNHLTKEILVETLEAPSTERQEINTIWGMDVLGPFPEASGKVKFVIVAIDYFTKWIEAKLLAKTTGKEERKEAAAIREARYKMKMETTTTKECDMSPSRWGNMSTKETKQAAWKT